jgi:hypothetical protein
MGGCQALLRTVTESYDGDEGAWDGIVFEKYDEESWDCIGDPITDNACLLIRIIETLADAVQSIRA